MQSNGHATRTDALGSRIRAGLEGTVLVCTAGHPRADEAGSRFAGRVHGIRLQHVPFTARATYREVRGWSDSRPGCLIVRCSSSDCRAFSEYEILGPVRTAQGAFLPSQSASGARAPGGHGIGTPFGALRTAIRRIRTLSLWLPFRSTSSPTNTT